MKFGLFPKEGGSWQTALDGVRLAERVGFDACWVNDHQATESENYWPAPLNRLAAVGAATETMELVTSILVLPLYHPLHVGQQAAMVDQISDGRLTLGLGLGYVPKEFAAFGVDMNDRAGRFVEGVRFLDEFLSSEGPISFDCPFWSVEDWQPLPQSVQSPRPPLWVGGWGPKAIARSVRLGDAWLPGVVAANEEVAERKRRQRDLLEERGGDWTGTAHPLMRDAIVARTHEDAMERGKEYLYESYRREYGTDDWAHPLLSADDVRDFESLAEDRFLVGTPDEVAAGIESIRERMPLDHLSVRLHHSGMPDDVFLDQIELFGEAVVPQFD